MSLSAEQIDLLVGSFVLLMGFVQGKDARSLFTKLRGLYRVDGVVVIVVFIVVFIVATSVCFSSMPFTLPTSI